MPASLLGESVTLTITHYDFSTGQRIQIYQATETVVSGAEFSGTVNYVGSTMVGSETWTRNETFYFTADVSSNQFAYTYDGSANTYAPSGLRFTFSSLADESVGSISSVTEVSGTDDGVFSSPAPYLSGNDVVMTPAPMGGGVSGSQVAQATLVEPNSPPSLGGTPANATVTEDVATSVNLSAYAVSDADGDQLTLTLAVNRGSIAATDGNGTTAEGVTIAGSGTTSMTLRGSATALNAFLDDTSRVLFTTAANDTAPATLTVTPNDGLVNGTADTVTLNVTPVNDEPTLTATGSDPTF
ncbi:hemolysin-type calcium-binding region, partial [Roseivivax marinus]